MSGVRAAGASLSVRLFGASMLASLLFLPKQGVERVCIWAEFMKITSGSETGELVSAAAFSDTQHAGSSQVPQRGWLALGECRFIYGQRVQHLRHVVRRIRCFRGEAAKIVERHAQVLRNVHCLVLAALPQFIAHTMKEAVSFYPSGDGAQHEFNRWVWLICRSEFGHDALRCEY